jgi:hypothetical protein
MWVPGTEMLRTSILVTWTDTAAGHLAVEAFAPRVPRSRRGARRWRHDRLAVVATTRAFAPCDQAVSGT